MCLLQVRGKALRDAVARTTSEFYIKFKDKLGQTAYAYGVPSRLAPF